MLKVSVITPVYNVEGLLRETLDSLLAQTLDGIEVLLVDDGSTDNSPAIIEEYCGKSAIFRSIRQENAGVAAARNRGLKEAKGEYVAFLDADDLYTPETLEAYYETAKRENAELVIGRIVKFDMASEHYFVNPEILARQRKINPFDKLLTWNFLLGHKLYLRRKIEELELAFQPLGYAEDAVFYTGFLYHCTRVAGCSRGLLRYRKRAFWETQSITQSVNGSLLEDFFTAHRLIYKEAGACWEQRIANACLSSSLRLQRDQFLDELNYKELFVLVDHFYRFFWRLNQETLDKIRVRYDELYSGMTPMNLGRMKKRCGEFRLNHMIMDRAVMARSPELSVAVELADGQDLERTLQGIYAQNYPAFEVLLPEGCRAKLADLWLEKENLHFVPGEEPFLQGAVRAARAPLFYYVDRLILPEITAFGQMVHAMGQGGEAAALGLGSLRGGVPSRYCFCGVPGADVFWCGRVWRVECLRKQKCLTGPEIFHIPAAPAGKPLVYLEEREEELLGELPEEVRAAVKELPLTEYRESAEPSPAQVKKMRRRHRLRSTVQWLFSRSERLNRFLFTCSGLLGVNLQRRYGTSNTQGPEVRRLDYYIKRLLLSVLRVLMGLVPVKKQVFFYSIRSDGTLLDNAKLVFDRVQGKKVVFAHKLPHSRRMKPEIYWKMLTSKVIVTDDYNRYLRTVRLKKNQRVVQLWHACGALKKFGLDAPGRLTPAKERATHAQYDAVLVSAPDVASCYESAFGVAPEVIKPLGVPRTDLLFDEAHVASLREQVIKAYPVLEGKTVILYCPTFREEGGVLRPYSPGIDWNMLDGSLKGDELFVIRRHPLMKETFLETPLPHVVDLTEASTLGLMAAAKVMVTDYSSVVYESALLGQPVVLYCPDYEQYERDFYLDYETDLPFPMCRDSGALAGEVRGALERPDREAIRQFCEKNMSACDGHSAERAAALVQEYLDS